jgi:glycolate oxidase FAD binding subunit
VGHVRDTVVELELITGDGRAIRSGARTVKNVTGYDIHRLATGSLGSLGVIVQAALKLRPLPQVRRQITAEGDGLELGERFLGAVFGAAAIVASAEGVAMWLEGWADEVEEQTQAARRVTAALEIDDTPAPFEPWAIDAPVIVEAAVVPSRIPELVSGRPDWLALLGVGLIWFGLPEGEAPLAGLRRAVAAVGGIAPVIKGPGGLDPSVGPAPDVRRRLKATFDPANILPSMA